MARSLIILGVMLIGLGLVWPWLVRLGLGRLPGDILIQRDHFRLYIPLTSSILVSVVLTVILYLLRK
jgi:hypothetical protein